MILFSKHSSRPSPSTVSFSQAAQQLYVPPRAVIQQMNNLERRMGTTLFVRSLRGVSLTDEGE